MTANSKANLMAADAIGFIDLELDGEVGMWLECRGRRAVLCGAWGPMRYPNRFAARRATKRLRPDLEPTDFQ